MTNYSMEVKLLAAINRRMREWERKWMPLVILWLTLVLVTTAVVPSVYGQEVGDITISQITCPDQRWLDIWTTTTTATWSVKPDEYDANLSDLLVKTKTGPGCFWGGSCRTDWMIVARVPYGKQSLDLTNLPPGPDGYRFVKENRSTGARTQLEVGPISVASCSIAPPPNDAAWVWDEESASFVLRIVEVVPNE